MIIKIIAGVVAYIGFILFVARMASDKWHPRIKDDT